MRWYALSQTTGMAKLCASEQDARRKAKAYDNLYPKAAQHVATRLQPLDVDEGLGMTEITAEMIREMEFHLPYSITSKVKQWEWKADFLNRAVKHPGAPCPCCGVTPNGDILDHLTLS